MRVFLISILILLVSAFSAQAQNPTERAVPRAAETESTSSLRELDELEARLQNKIYELQDAIDKAADANSKSEVLIDSIKAQNEFFYTPVQEKIAYKKWTFDAMFAGLGLFIGFGSILLGELALVGYQKIKESSETIAKRVSIETAIQSIEEDGGALHTRIKKEVHDKVDRMLLGDMPDFDPVRMESVVRHGDGLLDDEAAF